MDRAETSACKSDEPNIAKVEESAQIVKQEPPNVDKSVITSILPAVVSSPRDEVDVPCETENSVPLLENCDEQNKINVVPMATGRSHDANNIINGYVPESCSSRNYGSNTGKKDVEIFSNSKENAMELKSNDNIRTLDDTKNTQSLDKSLQSLRSDSIKLPTFCNWQSSNASRCVVDISNSVDTCSNNLHFTGETIESSDDIEKNNSSTNSSNPQCRVESLESSDNMAKRNDNTNSSDPQCRVETTESNDNFEQKNGNTNSNNPQCTVENMESSGNIEERSINANSNDPQIKFKNIESSDDIEERSDNTNSIDPQIKVENMESSDDIEERSDNTNSIDPQIKVENMESSDDIEERSDNTNSNDPQIKVENMESSDDIEERSGNTNSIDPQIKVENMESSDDIEERSGNTNSSDPQIKVENMESSDDIEKRSGNTNSSDPQCKVGIIEISDDIEKKSDNSISKDGTSLNESALDGLAKDNHNTCDETQNNETTYSVFSNDSENTCVDLYHTVKASNCGTEDIVLNAFNIEKKRTADNYSMDNCQNSAVRVCDNGKLEILSQTYNDVSNKSLHGVVTNNVHDGIDDAKATDISSCGNKSETTVVQSCCDTNIENKVSDCDTGNENVTDDCDISSSQNLLVTEVGTAILKGLDEVNICHIGKPEILSHSYSDVTVSNPFGIVTNNVHDICDDTKTASIANDFHREEMADVIVTSNVHDVCDDTKTAGIVNDFHREEMEDVIVTSNVHGVCDDTKTADIVNDFHREEMEDVIDPYNVSIGQSTIASVATEDVRCLLDGRDENINLSCLANVETLATEEETEHLSSCTKMCNEVEAINTVTDYNGEEVQVKQEPDDLDNRPELEYRDGAIVVYSDNDDDTSSTMFSSSSEKDLSDREDKVSDAETIKRLNERKRTLCRKIAKTEGEFLPEELPPIEYLTISPGEEVELEFIGTVSGIVNVLVVVKAKQNSPALYDDTVLFLKGRQPLGLIFETFGTVEQPYYSIRFNSSKDIQDKGIIVGEEVLYAPKADNLTKYVFVAELRKMKCDDASWEHDNAAPVAHMEFSDDEEERKAKQRQRNKDRVSDERRDGQLLIRKKRWRRFQEERQEPQGPVLLPGDLTRNPFGNRDHTFSAPVANCWPPKEPHRIGRVTHHGFRPNPVPQPHHQQASPFHKPWSTSGSFGEKPNWNQRPVFLGLAPPSNSQQFGCFRNMFTSGQYGPPHSRLSGPAFLPGQSSAHGYRPHAPNITHPSHRFGPPYQPSHLQHHNFPPPPSALSLPPGSRPPGHQTSTFTPFNHSQPPQFIASSMFPPPRPHHP